MDYTTKEALKQAMENRAPIQLYVDTLKDFITVNNVTVKSILNNANTLPYFLRINPYSRYAMELIKTDKGADTGHLFQDWLNNNEEVKGIEQISALDQSFCMLTYFSKNYKKPADKRNGSAKASIMTFDEVADIVNSYGFTLLPVYFGALHYQIKLDTNTHRVSVYKGVSEYQLHAILKQATIDILEAKLDKANKEAVEQATAVLTVTKELTKLQQHHKNDLDTFGASFGNAIKELQNKQIRDLRLALQSEQQNRIDLEKKLAKAESFIEIERANVRSANENLNRVQHEYRAYRAIFH